MLVIPALGKLRQDWEFKATLSYMVKSLAQKYKQSKKQSILKTHYKEYM